MPVASSAHISNTFAAMASPTLIDIPMELRNKILRSCMVIGIAVAPLWGSWFFSKYRTPNIEEPYASSQILCVCKQLQEEASPILYGENILYFRTTMCLDLFLRNKSLATKGMVKYILLREKEGLTTRLHELKFLVGLRSFTFLNFTSGPAHVVMDKMFGSSSIVSSDCPSRRRRPQKTLVRYLCAESRKVEVGILSWFTSADRFKKQVFSRSSLA